MDVLYITRKLIWLHTIFVIKQSYQIWKTKNNNYNINNEPKITPINQISKESFQDKC